MQQGIVQTSTARAYSETGAPNHPGKRMSSARQARNLLLSCQAFDNNRVPTPATLLYFDSLYKKTERGPILFPPIRQSNQDQLT